MFERLVKAAIEGVLLLAIICVVAGSAVSMLSAGCAVVAKAAGALIVNLIGSALITLIVGVFTIGLVVRIGRAVARQDPAAAQRRAAERGRDRMTVRRPAEDVPPEMPGPVDPGEDAEEDPALEFDDGEEG